MATSTTTLNGITTTRSIVLDVNKTNTVVYLAKQYDHLTRILKIQLIDNGQYVDFSESSGRKVFFRARHSDGSLIFNTIHVEKGENGKDTAVIELSNSALSVAGKTDCEIQICEMIDESETASNPTNESVVGGYRLLSSMTFIIQVRRSAYSEEELLNVARNEFSALIEAILLVYKMEDELSVILDSLQFMTTEDVENIINGTFVV